MNDAEYKLFRQRMIQREHNGHIGTLIRVRAHLRMLLRSPTTSDDTRVHIHNALLDLRMAMHSLNVRRNADGKLVGVRFKKDHAREY